MKKIALLLIVFGSVICQAKPKEMDHAITGAGNIFAFNLLRDISLTETPNADYVVISPLSASIALSMAANGAGDNTLDEMLTVMGFKSATAKGLNAYYKMALKMLLSADPDVQMNLANSIWVDDGFSVLKPYVKNLKKNYNAQASVLDFASPDAARTINAWCSEKTEGKIDEVITQIDPGMMMFLINALYFKGEWALPFDPAHNVTSKFSNANGNVKDVEMMNLTSDLPYFRNTEVSMVELDYGNGSFAMDIILPEEGISTKDVIKDISSKRFQGWVKYLGTEEVNVRLPKFKLEYSTSLVNSLCRLGMPEAFTSQADFRFMSHSPLMIGTVNQKTFIEVNEQGSEAAAVTVIGMMKSSFNPEGPKKFHVDRPFIFTIREKSSGIILFVGEVSNF